MHVIKYIKEAPDGNITCWYVDFLSLRFLLAVSEVNWYTRGVERKVPIWLSDKGLFVYKWAVRVGRRRETEEGE